MLKVVFFARVKEQLECGQLDIDWHSSLSNVGALEQHIFQLKGSHWESVLSEENIVRASTTR